MGSFAHKITKVGDTRKLHAAIPAKAYPGAWWDLCAVIPLSSVSTFGMWGQFESPVRRLKPPATETKPCRAQAAGVSRLRFSSRRLQPPDWGSDAWKSACIFAWCSSPPRLSINRTAPRYAAKRGRLLGVNGLTSPEKGPKTRSPRVGPIFPGAVSRGCFGENRQSLAKEGVRGRSLA